MLKMYSPSSLSQSRTLIAKEIPLCKYGVVTKLQVAKKGTRVGERFFYGCAFWPVSIHSSKALFCFMVIFIFFSIRVS